MRAGTSPPSASSATATPAVRSWAWPRVIAKVSCAVLSRSRTTACSGPSSGRARSAARRSMEIPARPWRTVSCTSRPIRSRSSSRPSSRARSISGPSAPTGARRAVRAASRAFRAARRAGTIVLRTRPPGAGWAAHAMARGSAQREWSDIEGRSIPAGVSRAGGTPRCPGAAARAFPPPYRHSRQRPAPGVLFAFAVQSASGADAGGGTGATR